LWSIVSSVTLVAASENPFRRLGFSFLEPDVVNICIACHGFHPVRSNFVLFSNAVKLQDYAPVPESLFQACRASMPRYRDFKAFFASSPF